MKEDGDLIRAGGGDDRTEGGDGDDRIGDEGDDIIVGDADNDCMHGGSGADLFGFATDIDALLTASSHAGDNVIIQLDDANQIGLLDVDLGALIEDGFRCI